MSGRADRGDEAPGRGWTSIHASAVVVGEVGVVIRGPSDSGKSALALALLAVARERRLFAALIGDDRVSIAIEAGRVLARGAPALCGLIERRGYGIVAARAEPCAVIRLVVDLLPAGRRVARMPEGDALRTRLADAELPCLTFDDRSAAIERAYATLGHVDSAGDKIMTGGAHFA